MSTETIIAEKWVTDRNGVYRCVRISLRPDVYCDGTVDRWVIETRTQHGSWQHYRNICNERIAKKWFDEYPKVMQGENLC